MDFIFHGNPGTGNNYQGVIIQHVENYYTQPAVINNNPDGGRYKAPKVQEPRNVCPPGTELIREEIIEYVSRIQPLLSDKWKSCYVQLWYDILSLNAVQAVVYDKGKQKKTDFNRKLIAGILHLLDRKNNYKDEYSPTVVAKALGHDVEHPMRRYLASLPDDKKLIKAIEKVMDRYV